MRTILVSFFVLLTGAAFAQYTPVDTVSGVEFATRWAREKWYKPSSDKVLLIRVTNRTDQAVEYQFQVEVSVDGKMVESSRPIDGCLRARGIAKGRLNGVVLKMTSLKQDQIASGNFDLELDGLTVEPLPGPCPPQE